MAKELDVLFENIAFEVFEGKADLLEEYGHLEVIMRLLLSVARATLRLVINLPQDCIPS